MISYQHLNSNILNPKSWRFGSDDFPDFNLVILRGVQGMKYYPVIWGLFHRPLYMRIPFNQPVFNGMSLVGFDRCSVLRQGTLVPRIGDFLRKQANVSTVI